MNNLNCPNCSSGMGTKVKYQVEIDYYPTCTGVWIKRGETEKLQKFYANVLNFEMILQRRSDW